MCGNYYRKLSQEIITGNYHRKLLASIYHHAKNVGIIGILAYPKNEINLMILFTCNLIYLHVALFFLYIHVNIIPNS